MNKLNVKKLQLADTVRLFDDGAFRDGVVTNIDDDYVYVERPYSHTADFSYTGGVIAYIGHENCKLPKEGNDRLYEVIYRKPLK